MICALVCAAGASAMLYMRQKVTETYAEDDGSIAQSEKVETGSLSTTVSGSGTLEAVGLTEVTVPANVEVSKIFCTEGSEVQEGDLLFSVDNASVLKAMKDVQDQIDTLDASLEDASSDEVSSSLTSGVSGRVKKIYAAAEDDVSSVMYSSGALMTLSLDGYMAVDVQTGLLNEGDSVTVTTSDGNVYTGAVDSVDGEKAVVLITDDGPAADDTVTVTFEVSREEEEAASNTSSEETQMENLTAEDASSEKESILTEASEEETVLTEASEEETELIEKSFTGTLYIHSPLSVTGYAGTVESVDVAENESISADTSLMTLTDTSYSANYDTILSQREELEETLTKLIVLYREGGIYAPICGKVSAIEDAYEDYVKDAGENDSGSDDASSGETVESAQATVSSQQSDLTASEDTAADTAAADAAQSAETSSGEETGESVVLTLDPNEEMTVDVSVDETDILAMQVGQTASITIDSIGEDIYTGTVTKIDTTAASSSGVTAYTVEVTIPRAEKMLSGMSAEAEIQVDGVENALLVSSEAVHKTSSSAYVYTTYDEETNEFGGMTEVTTGLSDGSKTEITGGLKVGDTIWYEKTENSQESGFTGMGGAPGGMDFGNMGQSGNSGQGPGSRSGNSSSQRPGNNSGSGNGSRRASS